MNGWKQISCNPYGYVYKNQNKQILKIIPEFQKKEVQFWKMIRVNDKEKVRFVFPKIIKKTITKQNLLGIPSGIYYFLFMDAKTQTLLNYCKNNRLGLLDEKKIWKDIGQIIELLHQQGFVHGDIHFDNIVKDRNDYFLIDFGLVMNKSFCKSVQEINIYQLYHWSNDDYYTLCVKLYFFGNERLLVKKNNYKKFRKIWIRFFSQNPLEWKSMKEKLIKNFDFINHEDYWFCFQYFIHHILTDSSILSPKPGIQFYDMLTKIYLDRMFLIFAIEYPKMIQLTISPERQKFYQSLL